MKLSWQNCLNKSIQYGQRWVQLSIVTDSAESSWALSQTALSPAEHCPGQRWVHLSIVPDSAESSWALSQTALSPTEHCPRQRWVQLSIVPAIQIQRNTYAKTVLIVWVVTQVLPYFQRLEDMRNKQQARDPSHGVGGPIAVEDRRHSTPLG